MFVCCGLYMYMYKMSPTYANNCITNICAIYATSVYIEHTLALFAIPVIAQISAVYTR